MPIESEELDRSAVPVPADRVAIDPVVPLIVVPVAAVLVPADDVDDADAPMEVDVVLAPGVAVVVLSGTVDVMPFDVPAPCAVVDVVVWAWSAVVPSMSSAAVTATARDGPCFI